MSRPPPDRSPLPKVGRLARRTTLTRATAPDSRRPSVTGAAKAQRTSKTSQRLVVLPSAPQTKPLEIEENETHGYETDSGFVRDYKNEGERMSKEQRKKAGFKRITVYCVAEGFKMKLLSSFLKREHNVLPRVYDEALYVMYHLPLLPGYNPSSNLRSSAPAKSPGGNDTIFTRMSEAEENGYQGTYFTPQSPPATRDGFIPSHSSSSEGSVIEGEAETGGETETETEGGRSTPRPLKGEGKDHHALKDENVAEVIFFDYGVVVFFGLDEREERGILEDVVNAGVMRRMIVEEDWEVEEFHYVHDPNILYPRIYNDFFTFKSPSHLLKLSVSHALAQSTLLARYETSTHRVLSSPRTLSIPQQLALTGALQLKRAEALKLTGKLFKLRRDVNLVSNVLDVPELFWSEATLKGLYDAVRTYMEIGGRVGVLNEKLAVASDLLDAIHDHLNNNAMERITWIIIWLIVVACLVELGEVLARIVVHATMGGREKVAGAAVSVVTREEALRALERMMVGGK